MKRKALLTTAIAALLVTGLATAEPAYAANQGQGRGAKMFDRHDVDGDGKITQEEFMTRCANRFKQMDMDGNGEMTKEEAQKAFEAYRGQRGGKGPGGSGQGGSGQGGSGQGGQGKGPAPRQDQPQ